MRQPTIRERKRNGNTTYFCDIGGQQFGLGTDAEQARVLFAELLAKQTAREELTAQVKAPIESAITVRAVLLAYLEWCKRNRAAATHQFYRQHIDHFDDYLVAQKLTSMLVTDFSPQHVEDWIESRYSDCSDTYKHNLIRALQAAFNWALKRKMIRDNPLTALEKPAQTPCDIYITEGEWQKVVAELKEGPFLDFLTVLRETGCRVIEAKVATAAEFDRENRRLYFENPPKKVRGKKRARVVLLTDMAFAICERLAGENPTGALFRNERDRQPWTKSAIAQQSRRLSKKVGFRFIPKALRHSFATDLLRQDQSPVKVAELMGHRDAVMLLTVYQKIHKCQDDLRAVLARRSPAA